MSALELSDVIDKFIPGVPSLVCITAFLFYIKISLQTHLTVIIAFHNVTYTVLLSYGTRFVF